MNRPTSLSLPTLALVAVATVAPLLARAADPATQPVETDAAQVTRLVGQLSDADPDARDRALNDIQDLPPSDLPLLSAAADRDDLSPEAAVRLHRVLPAVRQRAKLADRARQADVAVSVFYDRELAAEYAAGSHANPAWDANARECLRQFARRVGTVGDANVDAGAEARRQYKLAVLAGCNDPAVLACGALLLVDTGGADAAAHDLFARADAATTDGCAGPLTRLIINGRLLRPAAAYDQADRVRTWKPTMQRLDDMLGSLKRLVAVRGVPPAAVLMFANNIYDRLADTHARYASNVDGLIAPLDQALPNDPAALALKGRFYVQYAWEARGSGWANTVTPQGWKDFADRLATANRCLTRSWELDPDSPVAATEMLTVVLGQGGPPGAMDLWFGRAMAADPDNATACYSKLTILEPKWGGDPDAMLRFGHDCLAGGNWHSWVPLVLVDVHARLAGYAPDPAAYYLQPGVWEDLRATYAGYLKQYPDNDGLRNKFAYYAVRCHQWKAADEQFKRLAAAADATDFGDGTVPALDDCRDRAARLADKADEQGK